VKVNQVKKSAQLSDEKNNTRLNRSRNFSDLQHQRRICVSGLGRQRSHRPSHKVFRVSGNRSHRIICEGGGRDFGHLIHDQQHYTRRVSFLCDRLERLEGIEPQQYRDYSGRARYTRGPSFEYPVTAKKFFRSAIYISIQLSAAFTIATTGMTVAKFEALDWLEMLKIFVAFNVSIMNIVLAFIDPTGSDKTPNEK
jgi:hypothetical protein